MSPLNDANATTVNDEALAVIADGEGEGYQAQVSRFGKLTAADQRVAGLLEGVIAELRFLNGMLKEVLELEVCRKDFQNGTD